MVDVASSLYRSDLLDYAEKEIKLSGWLDSKGQYRDKEKELICKNVFALLKTLLGVKHNVRTVSYVRNMFDRLTRFLPIAPLTGEDGEWKLWMDGLDGDLYQNVRCSSVYKRGVDGQAYDDAAVLFWRWVERELVKGEVGYPGVVVDKEYFTSGASAKYIIFPYVVQDDPIYAFFPTDKFPNESIEIAPAHDSTWVWVMDES